MSSTTMTDFHAAYYANLLTVKKSSHDSERVASAIVGAQIDLNPHQVEAALFAFKSPLSKGVLLADEVGLGKTIEAGLVIYQHWNEGKQKILIIVPASLRKQWNAELKEKFFLDSIILDSATYRNEVNLGNGSPFIQDDRVVICSYQFAASHNEEIYDASLDLAVIDEAHKIRNGYKKSGGKIAKVLKSALQETKKILLTATPLQNSIMELYGIVSFIDDEIFGDQDAFSKKFAKKSLTLENFKELKERLEPLCHRTLRSEVLEYITYTERKALLQKFKYSNEEYEIYNAMTNFLRQDKLQMIQKRQLPLMTMLLYKILASSSKALSSTLSNMINRMSQSLMDQPIVSFDILGEEEMRDALFEDIDDSSEELFDEPRRNNTEFDEKKAVRELQELKNIKAMVDAIEVDTKLSALEEALPLAFEVQEKLGSEQKALIFTESRQTQEYIKEHLESVGYKNKVILFNGTNNSKESKDIYRAWLKSNAGSDVISGSKSADMKQALVDAFRNDATIMIATESGAEGINLQFCNMIINYDLPWNPQRIEQRIGRCHRYGQKYDVVVVNFLNQANAADIRVYELLSQKFKLFDGVFGSSDEVLGSIENGIDIEKKILSIYQSCRTPEDINTAFDSLQHKLEGQITQTMHSAQEKLLDNFGIDTAKKLEQGLNESKKIIYDFERTFWKLAKYQLQEFSTVDDETMILDLTRSPATDIATGKYELVTRQSNENHHILRQNSLLGEFILSGALDKELEHKKLIFTTNDSGASQRVMALKGISGYLKLSKVVIERFESEEYLLLTAMDDDYEMLESDIAKELFELDVMSVEPSKISKGSMEDLDGFEDEQIIDLIKNTNKKNDVYFQNEIRKIDAWADDLTVKGKDIITEAEKRMQQAQRERDSEKLSRLRKKLIQAKDGYKEILKAIDSSVSQKKSNLQDALKKHFRKSNVFIVEWELD